MRHGNYQVIGDKGTAIVAIINRRVMRQMVSNIQ